MCGHCIKSGKIKFKFSFKGIFKKVSVFTRTKSKASSLIELGVEYKNSPIEVAQESDIVISIVGYPKDVQQVYFND
jgi:3-hydroxyisobutyrate dehydrogenase-like beta-hydroxyacid dehydrogenase